MTMPDPPEPAPVVQVQAVPLPSAPPPAPPRPDGKPNGLLARLSDVQPDEFLDLVPFLESDNARFGKERARIISRKRGIRK